jgi:hypothetical protein
MAERAMRGHAASCGICAVNGDPSLVSGRSEEMIGVRCGSAATACDAYLVEIRG